ncbi:NAD(P)-binding domain-containing protein [Curvibacter sp. RS43]|uniref:NAD(P)-binding domain-containing protein n=1 Tax=Curvibacter microcysteis TaxID=3026419 RepID=A0ABT5MKK7_9BURK|nr:MULTISPECIES: NAD(P)-binding domain-containing protein [unclassified Curvibacter]MDD0811618.1 NAD(P)-binding domain-containing protein [Curvibacter sp. RS43]MDD0817048.1 NAD(P)-binding domain-containing protein [Curvibacter sp. HBC28]
MSEAVVDVAIVGAGPYGLSLAAHLTGRGVKVRIFGTPMRFWREHMPRGMQLKSDGFASSLSEPTGHYTLKTWCAENGEPYADMGLPVTLEQFCAYGEAFQRRCVPQLETTEVQHLSRHPQGFALSLANGHIALARQVVVATGIAPFAYLPEPLRGLPPQHVSHSGQHTDLSRFAGQTVAVLGSGASAGDTAALLQEGGAQVTLASRRPVRFHNPPNGPRSLWQRLRQPDSGLGPGWKSYLCAYAPRVFHALPQSLRLRAVARHLGPAPGWFVRDKVVGKVTLKPGLSLQSAQAEGAQLRLTFQQADGARSSLVVDHVIAATGYRTDLQRLAYIDPELREAVRTVNQTPVLDGHFQSSVPGLYFIGAMAANSFGPLLRFAYGADFTAKHLARHLG